MKSVQLNCSLTAKNFLNILMSVNIALFRNPCGSLVTGLPLTLTNIKAIKHRLNTLYIVVVI